MVMMYTFGIQLLNDYLTATARKYCIKPFSTLTTVRIYTSTLYEQPTFITKSIYSTNIDKILIL